MDGYCNNHFHLLANLSKDHHADHDEGDSWRNQQGQGHHQVRSKKNNCIHKYFIQRFVFNLNEFLKGYGSSMGSESYNNMPSSYYGSFQQYPNHSYGVNETGGPWSNNGGGGGDMFGGGYSGMHESSGGGGHYNVDGVFSGGNGGGFGNFGSQQQQGYGYTGYGNGDYNAWGPQQPRKQHYDDYYRYNP